MNKNDDANREYAEALDELDRVSRRDREETFLEAAGYHAV